MLRQTEPPFSVPPVRNARVGQYFDGLLTLAALMMLVLLHRYLVTSPAQLVAVSLGAASVGCLLLWLVQRRRQPVRAYAFEG
jgi:hypothetical protein